MLRSGGKGRWWASKRFLEIQGLDDDGVGGIQGVGRYVGCNGVSVIVYRILEFDKTW